jgi:hypothetical protein
MKTIRGFDLTAAALSLYARSIQAETDPNHGVTFIFPTSGLTFYYLDTINVVYDSSFTAPLLYTFCSTGPALADFSRKS